MNAKRHLRVLFVAPYVPSRIRVRPFQIVRHLAKAGHEVTVVALEENLRAGDGIDDLRDACVAVHIIPHSRWKAAAQSVCALPTRTPLWAAYCRSPQMAHLLQEMSHSGKYDVAHIEHLRAAHFGAALNGLPRVFDAVDCITALQKQMYEQGTSLLSRLLSAEEWLKLRRYEPRAYRPFARVVVTSDHDADELRSLDGKLPVHVIPNGVDLDYFKPNGIAAEPDTIVFSGKMSYRANEDAALFLAGEVLPLLRKHRPAVRLSIVGSGPSAALRALAEKDPAVTVTGYVDDLRPHLERASVAVCPMRIGVGIQNKALEAMAVGRGVVCSPLVSRSLPGAEARGAIQTAATAQEFADICGRLLADPDAARTAGENARIYVEEHHRWPHAAGAMADLYQEVRTEAKHPDKG